jgi:hypothetical protein
MYTVIVLVIGIFIGWNLPQPAWAKAFQDQLAALIRTMVGKLSNRP